MSRRGLVHATVSGVTLAAIGSQQVGCSPANCRDEKLNAQLGKLFVFLIELLFQAVGIGAALPTTTTLLNNSGGDIKIKIATGLVSEVRCAWVKGEDSPILTIPPGMHEAKSDGKGIRPDEVGNYHIDVRASESGKSSSTFTVS